MLAQRAPGERTGDIVVNGQPATLESMRQQLSYMPQDDIVYMQLSVRQLLTYSALLQCPRDWTFEAKKWRVEAIMVTLGMAEVASNKLGAVSGGQRKRASAAIEFLSGRPLLFMDEPTYVCLCLTRERRRCCSGRDWTQRRPRRSWSD